MRRKEIVRVLNTKVSEESYFRFQGIAKRNGMEPYGLLQLLVHASLRCSDSARTLDPNLQKLFSMFDNFEGMKQISSVAGTGVREVSSAIYFFNEKGKSQPSAMMVYPQFMGQSRGTYNATRMLECLLSCTFPGLLKRLKRIANDLGCNSVYETILELAEIYEHENDPDRAEIMQMFSDSNRGDFGQKIEFDTQYVRHKKINPDNHKNNGKRPNIQQSYLFEGMASPGQPEEDREAYDV